VKPPLPFQREAEELTFDHLECAHKESSALLCPESQHDLESIRLALVAAYLTGIETQDAYEKEKRCCERDIHRDGCPDGGDPMK
jgi:hypothetical protein